MSWFLLENSNNSQVIPQKQKTEELIPEYNANQYELKVMTPQKDQDLRDLTY
jgi:hypothetical protein